MGGDGSSLVKVSKKINIKEEFCKECGFCILYCPDNALEFHSDYNSKGFHPVKWKGDCSFCGRCYIVCPDFAIEIHNEANN